MDGRKNNRGTKGNKGGRPPKVEEQRLIEALTPLVPVAYKELEKAAKLGEQWAVRMIFEYYYGKPKQSIDVGGEGVKLVMEFVDG